MATVWEQVTGSAKLMSLPGVYLRLRAVLAEADFSMADVALVISQDPGLTARLLRLVNSPYFGLATKIETVFRAVSMLGTRQVHDLALATSVTASFAGMSNEIMDMTRFWRSSVCCGLLARRLAKACNVLDSERLFVAGLLRDIGHLIMYQTVPGLTEQAMLAAERKDRPLYLVERELIGLDYARIGGVLMRQWQLPGSIREATEFHVEPRRAVEFRLETCLVHLAALLVASMESGQEFGFGALEPDSESWTISGLSSPLCLSALAEAGTETDRVLDLFLPWRKAVGG